MVTHIGVVILTLGIVVSTSYTSRHEVTLEPHHAALVDGVKVTYNGPRVTNSALSQIDALVVRVNNDPLYPAVTTFHGTNGTTVGTPAIDSNLLRDVYVTFDAVGSNTSTSGAQVATGVPADAVVLGVTVEPMLSWLWLGGLIVAGGAALSFARRRYGEER
jgi:cytochrome c-type biogenesis protein CcmF